MAIDPSKWTTGHVAGDEKFQSASQIRNRIEAIRRNRGLSDSQHNQYWVDRIRAGKATIGDARTALTDKARAAIAKQNKKKKKKPVRKDLQQTLTADQIGQIMNRRRQATTAFGTQRANIAQQEQTILADLATRMKNSERLYRREREQGMDQLGARGMAAQPMMAGRFLKELRSDEMQEQGAIEKQRALAKGQARQARQLARQQRDSILADLAALEAAYKGGDISRLLGRAGL